MTTRSRQPSRALALALVATAALATAGCPSASSGLTVDVRTDYVAGDEFAAVRTEVSSSEYAGPAVVGTPRELAVAPAANFLAGTRVAEIRDLSPGTYWVRVSLLSTAGVPIAQRITSVQFAGSIAITSVIARSCTGVSCPPAGSPTLTSCNGGTCVDPHCAPEMPELCGAGECHRDADCTDGPTGACVRAVCEGGACLYGGDDSLCGARQRCSTSFTCIDDVQAPCGHADEPCCDGVCSAMGTICAMGTCRACGGREEPCCAGDTCRNAALCVDTPAGRRCQCGARSQICCDGANCDPGILCQSTGFGPLCLCGSRDRPCCPGRVCDDGSFCADTGFGPICVCGRRGVPCCPSRVCDDGSFCIDTGFGPLCLCGNRDQPCCPGRSCDDGSTCLDTGFGPLCLCGTMDRPCCAGGACDAGLSCNATGFGPICQ